MDQRVSRSDTTSGCRLPAALVVYTGLVCLGGWFTRCSVLGLSGGELPTMDVNGSLHYLLGNLVRVLFHRDKIEVDGPSRVAGLELSGYVRFEAWILWL
jgi:hypothetical protein